MAFRNNFGRGESELIQDARSGSEEAFEELFRLHHRTALKMARATTSLDSDDVVSEAFASVFRAIGTGGGPDRNFRAYLRSAIRNAAIQMSRKPAVKRERASGDNVFDLVPAVTEDHDNSDEMLTEIINDALNHLPQRWTEVLWATEVDGLKPRELTDDLDMSSNAVAGLSRRARNGFKAEFSKQVAEHTEELHAFTVTHRAAHEAGELSPMTSALIMAHTDTCDRCDQAAFVSARALIWPAGIWLAKAAPAVKAKYVVGLLAGGREASGWQNNNTTTTVAASSVAVVALAVTIAAWAANRDTDDTSPITDSALPAATTAAAESLTDDNAASSSTLVNPPPTNPPSTTPIATPPATTATSTTTPKPELASYVIKVSDSPPVAANPTPSIDQPSTSIASPPTQTTTPLPPIRATANRHAPFATNPPAATRPPAASTTTPISPPSVTDPDYPPALPTTTTPTTSTTTTTTTPATKPVLTAYIGVRRYETQREIDITIAGALQEEELTAELKVDRGTITCLRNDRCRLEDDYIKITEIAGPDGSINFAGQMTKDWPESANATLTVYRDGEFDGTVEFMID